MSHYLYIDQIGRCINSDNRQMKQMWHSYYRNVTFASFVPEQRSAFLVGANRDVGAGILSKTCGTMNCGSLNRGSRIVDTYQPSHEPNDNTLQWMIKKEKEVETDEDAPVNPTYIDDDLEGHCKSFPCKAS